MSLRKISVLENAEQVRSSYADPSFKETAGESISLNGGSNRQEERIMKPAFPFAIPVTEEFSPNHLPYETRQYLDLAYAGQSPDQVLDLYLPETRESNYPLIIYIHEGAFAFGSKRDKRMETLFAALERGYALASIDYRKSDCVTWPAQIYDVKAAVRYLRENAPGYGLDPQRFALWGMSAGGYLASIVGVTADNPGFEDPGMGCPCASSRVQAVVDLCGACSGFDAMDGQILENGIGRSTHNNENSPESIMMGGALPQIKELNRLAAPITYVHKDMPPFFIEHCIPDPTVPPQQSAQFAEAIAKTAGPEKVRIVFSHEEADHGKPDYHTTGIVKEALDFLDEVLQA